MCNELMLLVLLLLLPMLFLLLQLLPLLSFKQPDANEFSIQGTPTAACLENDIWHAQLMQGCMRGRLYVPPRTALLARPAIGADGRGLHAHALASMLCPCVLQYNPVCCSTTSSRRRKTHVQHCA